MQTACTSYNSYMQFAYCITSNTLGLLQSNYKDFDDDPDQDLAPENFSRIFHITGHFRRHPLSELEHTSSVLLSCTHPTNGQTTDDFHSD